MTGPDHYREAERLLEEVKRTVRGRDFTAYAHSETTLANMRAAAQVHATLALVAAVRGQGDTDWLKALG